MGRKPKRFIDPKKAVRYVIVERGTDDVLAGDANAPQHVLKVVQDKRPLNKRHDDPLHVLSSENGELPINVGSGAQPQAKRGSVAKSSSIFEDDDEPMPKKSGKSMFSDDDEEGSDFDDNGDDYSSGVDEEDTPYDEDELDEDMRAHTRDTTTRQAGLVAVGGASQAQGEQVYIRGGYDYGKHMKSMGTVAGAVYIAKGGKMQTLTGEEEIAPKTTARENPLLLPDELFASKPSKQAKEADQHDKMFSMIQDVDPEILAALDAPSDDDDDDPENQLDDDFVMQAMRPAEGDMDTAAMNAYLDQIIKTGRLPGDLADPFGDDLEDIDDFVTDAPRQQKGTSFKPKGRQTNLDDIDDDFEAAIKRKPGRGVHFEEEEEDEEDEEFEEDGDMFEDDDVELDEVQKKAAQMGKAIPGRAPLNETEAARAYHRFESALAAFDKDDEEEGMDTSHPGYMPPLNLKDPHIDGLLDDFLDEAVSLGLRPATSKAAIKHEQRRKAEREAAAAANAPAADANTSEEVATLSTSMATSTLTTSSEQSTKDETRAEPTSTAATATKAAIEAHSAEEDAGEDDHEEEEERVPDNVSVRSGKGPRQVHHYDEQDAQQWDVESYISTYTNTENHPRVVGSIDLARRIHLGREGVPVGVLEHERKKAAKERKVARIAAEEAALHQLPAAPVEVVNKGVARSKDETPEERKARKEAAKLEKKLTRDAKRELKEGFRQETRRQQRQEAGNSRSTIVHM